MVLVSSGVYRESISIRHPGVVLRGKDRNHTVIDGEFKRANGITVTGAASVVENITVRHHMANGILFTGVTDEQLQGSGAGGSAYDPLDTKKFPPIKGFRASNVTAHNNALYGIYAFDAKNGVIENSYGSGHADSGIYVGQCDPCNTVVRNNVLEHNAIGIEVTNASNGLHIVANNARRNRVGMTINSNDLEALGPQHGAHVVGNTVVDNNDNMSPEQADGGFGIGIGVGGGSDNVFQRNRIEGNKVAEFILRDVQGYPVKGNQIADNSFGRNGVALVLAARRSGGNCFMAEDSLTTSPSPLPRVVTTCGSQDLPLEPAGTARSVEVPQGISFKVVPAPKEQPQMTDPEHEPARPALNLPGVIDLKSYPLPKAE
ncbi:right-handed parallel beta-helix repeat-containing protein [Streptomyces sp. NPDC006879]|uniref:right-handed parallel beta-helix repeat-containing protein n=1 Tax=Streptomyces sp. NPDC006879 TaxID=3364767 RepID=UPI0036ADE9E6